MCVYLCVCLDVLERESSLSILRVATGNPNVNIILGVIFWLLKREMCHRNRCLWWRTAVNKLHLPQVEDLEGADAVADEKREDLRDKVQGCDGE